MKKLLLILTLLFAFDGFSQKQWIEISDNQINGVAKMDRASFPKAYKLFAVDFEGVKAKLLAAPKDNSGESSSIICSFPGADGILMDYRMYESAVLHPDLAAKFKNIKTYVGQGIKDPTATINISITLFGLHAQVLSGVNPTVLIDTYTKDNLNYIVYEKNSLVSGPRSSHCNFIGDESSNASASFSTLAARADDSLYRTYRMAMACTIEYAAYHVNAAGLSAGTIAQKKAAVLSAMTVTVTRLNGVYSREMSLQFQLVPNNDAVIFIDTDNFTNANTNNALLNESQTEIDAAIGSANYDIGHTVSTGGGGVAQKPSVCVAGKARGVTGSPAPVGDTYDIDFVAHEVGHQFGADHTFSSDTGNCAGTTRAVGFAVEPGSGSTIMAYAGICAPQDVQPNSNDYFSVVSLAQMFSHIRGAGNCQPGVANGNFPPVIPALSNITIPKGTPFILTAPVVTDANGDALTYCWEQTNTFVTATSSPTGASTATTGALFRSYSPTTSTQRYFPRLASVVANNLFPLYESLPSVARSLAFALTVRDNRNPNGGQTARANMTVTVSLVGPFNVTSQNGDGISWTPGTTETITWTANTASLAGSANMDIMLSTDGGLTFPTVLASNVPNNGSANIIVPNVQAEFCRVMVKPTGNIYYDINEKKIAIGFICNALSNSPNASIADGTGENAAGAVTTEIINFTNNVAINNMKVSVSSNHSWVGDLVLRIKSPSNNTVTLWSRNCNNPKQSAMNATFSDAGVAPICVSPISGEIRAASTGGNPLVTVFNSMAVFNGTASAGDWTLTATDNYIGDTGAILSWGIDFGCRLSNDSFNVDDFVLYPNPNKGSFNLKFNAVSSNVKVTVFDISGRQIYQNSYDNETIFNQDINLKNPQAGIYVVNIVDGERVVVKKIIIE